MTIRTGIQPEPVLDVLKTHFDVPAETTADTHFESLDLDSLVLIEFAVILAKQYDIDVAADELATAGTAAGVAGLLSAKGAHT
ncbi:acyl carrier protein [Streptomyces sp. NBC_00080]|uniref:acyl carrier protein n=1 Tax=unclassified Streptomyces TaxID=2593676 RepID=UPI00115180DF|nr:acyl carrier protein [Streptomyces sp. SLBN-115]TQJ37148.1 acyl carrier protein [Streptomyces sp. SLBN-115]